MAQSETGHAASRAYIDQDGDFHLNSANFRLDESGTVLSTTEFGYLDGVTAGTLTPSKAVVVNGSNTVDQITVTTLTTTTANTTTANITTLAMAGALKIKRNTPVAATGAVIANAAALTTGFTLVSGADNTVGVQIPVMAAGEECIVYSNAAGKVLKIYPQVGGQINEGGANTAYSTAAAAGMTIIVADSNTSAYAK